MIEPFCSVKGVQFPDPAAMTIPIRAAFPRKIVSVYNPGCIGPGLSVAATCGSK